MEINYTFTEQELRENFNTGVALVFLNKLMDEAAKLPPNPIKCLEDAFKRAFMDHKGK
jgi:hypothetical protein